MKTLLNNKKQVCSINLGIYKTYIKFRYILTNESEEEPVMQRLACMLPGVSAGRPQPAAAWPPPQSLARQPNTERGSYGLDGPPLTQGSWARLQRRSVKLTKERTTHNHPSSEIIHITSHSYSSNIFHVLKINNEWKTKKEIWTKSSEKRAQWTGKRQQGTKREVMARVSV